MMIPRRLRSEIVHREPYFQLVRHELETDGGSRHVITFAMPDWVSVVALTDDRRLVLVRQHRHGVDAATIEPAGGLVDPGEAPDAAGLRELLEETGYEAARVEPLGWVHPNPALQDNRCHIFLACGARPTGAPQNDEDEHTEVVTLALAEARAAIVDGRVTHALAVVSIARALDRVGSGVR